jgi:hypothetical protein
MNSDTAPATTTKAPDSGAFADLTRSSLFGWLDANYLRQIRERQHVAGAPLGAEAKISV